MRLFSELIILSSGETEKLKNVTVEVIHLSIMVVND